MEDTRMKKRNEAECSQDVLEQEKNAAVPGAQQASAVSETWAEETIADLDDFIESQGIYIRQ